MVGTRIENGGLQNTPSGYTLEAEGLQETAGTAKEKLDGQLDVIRRDLHIHTCKTCLSQAVHNRCACEYEDFIIMLCRLLLVSRTLLCIHAKQ